METIQVYEQSSEDVAQLVPVAKMAGARLVVVGGYSPTTIHFIPTTPDKFGQVTRVDGHNGVAVEAAIKEAPIEPMAPITMSEAKKMWLELDAAWMMWSNFGGWPSDNQCRWAAGLEDRLGIEPNQLRDSRFTWDYRDYLKK